MDDADNIIELELSQQELHELIGPDIFNELLASELPMHKWDDRLFTEREEGVMEESRILKAPLKFCIPSVKKLIDHSGNIDMSSSGISSISDIVYTHLDELMSQALILRDERDVKILTHHDIINAIRLLTGDRVIYSNQKSK